MPLPTPDEWNALHPKPVMPLEMAPVRCKHCGSPMHYPFGIDFRSNEDIVRCTKRGCEAQTTINK